MELRRRAQPPPPKHHHSLTQKRDEEFFIVYDDDVTDIRNTLFTGLFFILCFPFLELTDACENRRTSSTCPAIKIS
jgi:hypothetical protein